MPKIKKPRKSHLHHHLESPSGFIFFCDRITKPECFGCRVFGLPISKIDAVMRIQPGTPLFLFDCELRILYGVYSATSHGGANLVPQAFAGKFQAQVKFKIERNCHPVHEGVFKHAIQENYSKSKFRPDLNSQQVNRLLSLFQDDTGPRQPPPHADPRYAYQTVMPPTSVDPRYFPSSAPTPPIVNQYYSAPANDPYFPARPPPPPPPPSSHPFYATQPPAQPPPPSNDQYGAVNPYYQAQPPPQLPHPPSSDQYRAVHQAQAQPPPPQTNEQHYAVHPYFQPQTPVPPPPPSNGGYYVVHPHYLVQPSPSTDNQYCAVPPYHPAQLPPSSHPAPPYDPCTQGNAVLA